MQTTNGKDIILLVQPIDATIGSDGLVVANQTESSRSIENETIDEMTKFGRVLEYGENSESFELTCYGRRNDPGQMAILSAIEDKKKLKVWEVDIKPNADGEYDSRYAICLVESVEESNGDSFKEVSATLQVEGKSVKGTLPEIPDLSGIVGYDFETPGETGEPTP